MFIASKFLRRVVHSASDPGIELRVTQVTNRLFAIKTLLLGFADYFTGDDYADLADSVQFRVESAGVDLAGVDCCAECNSRGVDLMFY